MKHANKFSYFLSLTFLVGTLFFSSCKEEDESVTPSSSGEEGYYIVNEGQFGAGNASLSFFDKETSTMTNDIYYDANDQDLGDQAQSMTIIGDKGYVVIQNSNKIEVIDLEDHSSVATIDGDQGLVSPRYLLAVNEQKAYVSDWGADGVEGSIKVLDLETNKITKTIATGAGANKMVKLNNKVYIANAGGYNTATYTAVPDSTVAVVDVDRDKVVDRIVTGYNPKALQIDSEDNLWVVGAGKTVYNEDFTVNLDASTAGYIVKVATSTHEVVLTSPMEEKASGPGKLVISPNKEVLYFDYKGSVYTTTTSQTEAPISMKSFVKKNFYGYAIDPSNGNFIGTETPNFTSAGTLYVYDDAGSPLSNTQVGIGPNSVTFK